MSTASVEITAQMKAYMKALGVDANGLHQITFRHFALSHSLGDLAIKKRSGGNVSVRIGDILSHNSLALNLLNNLRLSIAPSSTWADIANVLAIGASMGALVGVVMTWLTLAF